MRFVLLPVADSSDSVEGNGEDMPVVVWGEEAGVAFELKLNLNLEERGVEGEAGIKWIQLFNKGKWYYEMLTLICTLAHVRQYCFSEEADVVDAEVEDGGSSWFRVHFDVV